MENQNNLQEQEQAKKSKLSQKVADKVTIGILVVICLVELGTICYMSSKYKQAQLVISQQTLDTTK